MSRFALDDSVDVLCNVRSLADFCFQRHAKTRVSVIYANIVGCANDLWFATTLAANCLIE